MKRLIRSGHDAGHTIRKVGVRLTGVTIFTGGLALMGFGTIGSPLSSGGVVAAAPGGNSNSGDVWVDNVGNPAGPGHENDPHLDCADINVWGNGLSDPSGSYTVDGWPPSGSQEQDYPATGEGTWSYDTATGGDQVTAVIDVDVLIANAIANGDTAQAQQGFHFKLEFSQDPQKHKVFWVDCPGQTTTTTSSTTSTTSSDATTSSSSTTTSSSHTTTSSEGTTSTTSSSSHTTTTQPTTTTTTSTDPTTTSHATTTSTDTDHTTTTKTDTDHTTTTKTSTHPTTVTSSLTTKTTTTATSTGSSSTSSTLPPTTTTSSGGTTSATPTTGVLGANTGTPSTGADIEFGLGVALALGGGGLMIGATRFGRRKRS